MIYNTWHYATKTIKDIMQPQPSANCDGCLKLNWSVSKIYEIRKTSRIPKQRHKILTCRCRYIVSHHVMATFCGPSCKPQACKESGFEQQMIILYSYIHVYSYIYMHTISYEHGKQVNKWTQARNDKWNPDIYWKTWKTPSKRSSTWKRWTYDSWLVSLSHPISSTRLHMQKLNQNQGVAALAAVFLLVVRIKVQPTQQEAEDANLRVSFWLVLTLPNEHRNFRTLIRIA